jgi:hypothetical protein
LRVGVIIQLLATGDIVGATERFEQERAQGFVYAMTGGVQILSDAADCAVELDDREAAAVILERLEPHRGRIVFTHAIAPHPIDRARARLAALLGHDEDAEQSFEVALGHCERLGAPYYAARTHVERAEMYARRGAPGDRDRAERDLEAALEFAARCEGVSIERRVDRIRAQLD